MAANASPKAPVQEIPKQPAVAPEQVQAAPQEISSVEADREAFEQFAESKGESPEQARKDVDEAKAEAVPVPTVEEVQKIEKDPVMVEVEKILEAGLADHWKAMPDALKPMFKLKGEQVAHTISAMIKQNL